MKYMLLILSVTISMRLFITSRNSGSGMTVVVDPGPAFLPHNTADSHGNGMQVLTVNGIMDGTFPGRLPEPSPEGLRALSDLVVTCGAAFGVAHDGDADRSVFVDEKGQFVEETRSFALIARHVCNQKKVRCHTGKYIANC